MTDQAQTLEEQIDLKERKDKLMALIQAACIDTQMDIIPIVGFDKYKGVFPTFELVNNKRPAETTETKLAPTGTKKSKNGKNNK